MKRSVTIVIFVALAATLFGGPGINPAADPHHPIYDDFDRWLAQGVITEEPAFRPYPQDVIERLLRQVERRGSRSEAARAGRYLEALSARDAADIWAYGGVHSDTEDVAVRAGAGFDLNFELFERFDLNGTWGAFATEEATEEFLPTSKRDTLDILDDNAKISAGGRDIYTLMAVESAVSYVGEKGYVQAGIMRRSFGPLHEDSPVVSDDANQAGGVVVGFDFGKIDYTASLFSLSATQSFATAATDERGTLLDFNDDQTPDLLALENAELVPGKLMYLQRFGVQLFPWAHFSFFEAAITGPRVEMAYLVPFKLMWHAQGTAAYADNSFMGLTLDLRPAPRWRIPMVAYVDDANFNDIAALSLDTKIKAAASGAIQFAPEPEAIDMLSLQYDAVLPYMYTHASQNPYVPEPNYLDYLHQDQNLGSGLLPNSDRLTARANLRLPGEVTLGLFGAVLRHANASEGVIDQYINDGGYTDAGRGGEFEYFDADGDGDDPDELIWNGGRLTFQEDLRFLTQENIEQTYQAGFEVGLERRVGSIDAALAASYTFERVTNPISYVWTAGQTDGGGGRTVTGEDQTNHLIEIHVTLRY